SIVTEMNEQVLGLVGGLAGGDAGSAGTVDELGMPVVNVAISKPFDDAALTYNVNPYFADVNQPLPKYEYLHSQGVRKAAIVLTAVDQTRSEINLRHEPQMKAAGIEVVLREEVPMSTLSYDSAARAVANSGADYLLFLADGSISASMARSMYDTGYDGLKFADYLTAYGSKFPELAGPGAEGAVSPIRTLPNEEAGSSPEQQSFLEWFGRVAPDQPADTFAADSWVAAKAFIDNLEALPGPITREALVAQLSAVGEYDAGGLLGPIDLGGQASNGCVILMRYESGSWKRIAPDQGFLC
ncbi:MAG TPA: ABC transporter substrate-binding protein, partial [Acidimicrobiales bacterium]|nr:ABC transporter substrate-binding protein [Acidimicrobiales bacterium]